MAGRLHIADINVDLLLAAAELPPLRIKTPLLTHPNRAPRHPTSIIALAEDGIPELRAAFWGLTPAWLKQLDKAPHCARVEALNSRPMNRTARHRRCAVPVTGIYAWATQPGCKQSGRKQPFMITRVDRRPILLAGVCDVYPDPTAALNPAFTAPARRQHRASAPPSLACQPRDHESFALITVKSNALIAPLSERLPAIVEPSRLAAWLSPDTAPEAACALLATAPLEMLGLFPVSRAISAPSCQEWHLSQPIGPMRTADDEGNTSTPRPPLH